MPKNHEKLLLFSSKAPGVRGDPFQAIVELEHRIKSLNHDLPVAQRTCELALLNLERSDARLAKANDYLGLLRSARDMTPTQQDKIRSAVQKSRNAENENVLRLKELETAKERVQGMLTTLDALQEQLQAYRRLLSGKSAGNKHSCSTQAKSVEVKIGPRLDCNLITSFDKARLAHVPQVRG